MAAYGACKRASPRASGVVFHLFLDLNGVAIGSWLDISFIPPVQDDSDRKNAIPKKFVSDTAGQQGAGLFTVLGAHDRLSREDTDGLLELTPENTKLDANDEQVRTCLAYSTYTVLHNRPVLKPLSRNTQGVLQGSRAPRQQRTSEVLGRLSRL